MVLEKTLESPLDCKEIQPVHSEGDQPCKRLREGAEKVGPGWFLEHLYPASLAARDFDLFVDVMLLN